LVKYDLAPSTHTKSHDSNFPRVASCQLSCPIILAKSLADSSLNGGSQLHIILHTDLAHRTA
jgi:hypothetical protein